METKQIAELLRPFLDEGASALSETQFEQISNYLDLLLRWNTRINLTSVREPEQIITRHFGESLFTAWHLFRSESSARARLIDFGSGAGFPGLPIKIWAPDIPLTLVESNQKKATFLREVVRHLALTAVAVFSGRAEEFDQPAEILTLRAVERFEKSLPIATELVAPRGRLALLVGQAQVEQARQLQPRVHWEAPIAIPQSSSRVLLIGIKEPS